MKKLMFGAAIAGLGLAMTGCCMPNGPYAVAGSMGIVADAVTPGAYAIDNSVKPVKTGTATSKGIILFTSGDNSIKAAMANGDIKKIHHVDFDVLNVFNLYSKVTTIVYGE